MFGLKIKSCATLLSLVYPISIFFLFSFSPWTFHQPPIDETLAFKKGQAQDSGLVENLKPVRAFKTLRTNVTVQPVLQIRNSERKLLSYFLTNDIHFNLPQIKYKFPISKHTEAG
jgi:hypothetical protein